MIQRTKDREFLRIDDHFYRWKGELGWATIPNTEFWERVKDRDLETFDSSDLQPA